VSVTGNGLVNSQSGGTEPGSGFEGVVAAGDGAGLTAGSEIVGSGSRSLGAQAPSTRTTATTAKRLTRPA
jgi:hypothetical protein